jgi:hypothetical protein
MGAKMMLPEVAREELTAVLDAVASETLAEACVCGPPIDGLALARRLGLTVAWDDRQQGRARLVNLAGGREKSARSILLKHDLRVERVNWAAAHEIGESLAQRVFAELAVDASAAPQQARSDIANGMASRLLLPTQWFSADGKECDWDLVRLKEIYGTASHELIARRMLDFSRPVIMAVFDQNRLTWRKTNVGFRMPPLGVREIACRREAHDHGEAVYDDGPPALRVWPVHEPLWIREIMRVEVDEFAVE